jgi:hypothetical protein
MMVQMIKSSFEALKFEACVASRPVKVESSKIDIIARYRSEFYAVCFRVQESQF